MSAFASRFRQKRRPYKLPDQYTDNPTAERIYVEAGFAPLNIGLTNWEAWLQG